MATLGVRALDIWRGVESDIGTTGSWCRWGD